MLNEELNCITKMTSICIAPGCKSLENERHGISFFSFPKDKKLLKGWKLIINNKKIIKTMKICSRHFLKSDFLNPRRKAPILKKDAVPSLFFVDKKTPKTIIESPKTSNPGDLLLHDKKMEPVNINELVLNNSIPPENTSCDEEPCCDVPSCGNKALDGVSFFKAPNRNKGQVKFKYKDGTVQIMDRRTAWLKLASLEDDVVQPKRQWRFCSKHFKQSDFKLGTELQCFLSFVFDIFY